MKKDLVIVGSGGFAREIYFWFENQFDKMDYNFKGFISPDPSELNKFQLSSLYYGTDENVNHLVQFHIAIGDPLKREILYKTFLKQESTPATLIHPLSFVASSAKIKSGALVAPYATVSAFAEIGHCTALNLNSIVGHDSKLGNFSVLSPSAVMTGGSEVGTNTLLGTNCSIGPNVKVGSNVKISANTPVLKNVENNTIVFSSPPNSGFLRLKK